MVKRCLKYYVIAQIINLKVALQPQQILLFSLSTKSEEIVSFLFPPLLFKWDQIVYSNQINYVIVVSTLGVPILSLSYTRTCTHPFSFSPSHSPSLSFTHSLFLSLSLSVSFSFSLSVSFSFSLNLSLSLSLSLFLISISIGEDMRNRAYTNRQLSLRGPLDCYDIQIIS